MKCERPKHGETPCNSDAAFWLYEDGPAGGEFAMCREHTGVWLMRDLSDRIRYVVPVIDKQPQTSERRNR